MTNYSVTVTGAVVDLEGKVYAVVDNYNGEAHFSILSQENDVTGGDPDERGITIYENETWFTDLWRADEGIFFITDADGVVHIGGDDNWTVHKVSERALNVVWGLSVDSVFVAGDMGIVYHWDGSDWNQISDPLGAPILCIQGFSEDLIYVTGEAALLWYSKRGSWTQVALPTNSILAGLLVLSEDQVLIAGSNGTMFRGSEQTWQDISVSGSNLFDLQLFQNEIYVASGADGVFMLKDDDLVPTKDNISAYKLEANSKFLAVAGDNLAARFDGSDWFGTFYD